MSAFRRENHSHLPEVVLRGLRPSVWLWVTCRAVTRMGLRLLVPGPVPRMSGDPGLRISQRIRILQACPVVLALPLSSPLLPHPCPVCRLTCRWACALLVRGVRQAVRLLPVRDLRHLWPRLFWSLNLKTFFFCLVLFCFFLRGQHCCLINEICTLGAT